MKIKINKSTVLDILDEVLYDLRSKVTNGTIEQRHATVLMLSSLEDLYEDLVDSDNEVYK